MGKDRKTLKCLVPQCKNNTFKSDFRDEHNRKYHMDYLKQGRAVPYAEDNKQTFNSAAWAEFTIPKIQPSQYEGEPPIKKQILNEIEADAMQTKLSSPLKQNDQSGTFLFKI